MKDIKSYVIGFLTCACLFLIMGQTSDKGNYEFDSLKINKAIMLQDGDNQLVITAQSLGILTNDKQLIIDKDFITFSEGRGENSVDRGVIGRMESGEMVINWNDANGKTAKRIYQSLPNSY